MDAISAPSLEGEARTRGSVQNSAVGLGLTVPLPPLHSLREIPVVPGAWCSHRNGMVPLMLPPPVVGILPGVSFPNHLNTHTHIHTQNKTRSTLDRIKDLELHGAAPPTTHTHTHTPQEHCHTHLVCGQDFLVLARQFNDPSSSSCVMGHSPPQIRAIITTSDLPRPSPHRRRPAPPGRGVVLVLVPRVPIWMRQRARPASRLAHRITMVQLKIA
jgi:hypothetical protein